MQPGKFEYETTRKLKKTIKSDARVADCARLYHRLGSFVNPGKKFLPNSGVAGTAIAMVLGALVMIIIAFSYAYMVPKYPKAGGEFTFTKECYGKIPAYVCGWFLVAAYLTNVPMNSTAIPLIIEGLFGDDCYNMCGVAFFKAKDARIVADAINEAYAHKGEYENLFWDDIVDRKLKEIDLTVHPINSDTIVEIDSVKELETIDPDYKNFN